ncbi:MAG: polymorphic toxin type 47 domain-containing protein [Bacteroidia bacterium]
MDEASRKGDEIEAERPDYVTETDPMTELDGRKRGQQELDKNDADFEDKLEAFVQAVVITEAADKIDEPVSALLVTLNSIIGSRFKVDFKSLYVGPSTFDILMNPKVKKGYTGPEIGKNKSSDLTGGNWTFDPKKDIDWRGTGKTYHEALDDAFKRTGIDKSEFKITKWAKDKNGKSIPVEWEGPDFSNVNMDIPEWNNLKSNGIGEGPHQPHIGYQMPGKRKGNIGRGHIFIDEVPATR